VSDIMAARWADRARQTVISGGRLAIAESKSCNLIDRRVADQRLQGQILGAVGKLAGPAAVKPPPTLASDNQIAAAHQMVLARRAMASGARVGVNSVRV